MISAGTVPDGLISPIAQPTRGFRKSVLLCARFVVSILVAVLEIRGTFNREPARSYGQVTSSQSFSRAMGTGLSYF